MGDSGRSNEVYDPKTDPKHKAKSNDPGWKYGYWPDPNIKGVIECILCGKQVHQGITRFKQHLAVGYGDVSNCPKTTPEIMREMREALLSNKQKKPPIILDYVDEEDEVQVITGSGQASTPSTAASTFIPSSGTSAKRSRSGTLHEFSKPQAPPAKQAKTIVSMLRKTPEEVVYERHKKGSKQTTLENMRKTPEEKEMVYLHIAKFFYACGIPFNVAHSRHYEVMIESVGQYGPGLKPPSYHELRVPLLEKVKTQTDQLRTKHESAWKKYGCTLMSDGWTDRRGRHLINFLANSPDGTFFMGSVDASSESHNHLMLANLLQSKIEEIGKEYVVQIVTDNGANYKKACQLLTTERFPNMFWTPCAAHCIDLMLEDIGSYKPFDVAIKNAKRITSFIYRHGRLHDAMKKKLGRELVRPGATRFATSFLTMHCLYIFRDQLKSLFLSGDWSKSNLAKSEAGKQVYDLIFSGPLWNNIANCIMASQPLLVALRVVDADEKPAMPEMIAAMEKAKKTIRDSFENNASLCKFIIDIVDKRWDTQMGVQLYSAGLFLNPGKFFDIQERDYRYACKLREDFNDVIEKMVPDTETRDLVSSQTDNYEHKRENFARQMAIDQSKTKSPLDWWSAFGGRAPDLAMIAKHIIGLCCSSSGCERNWSTFEFIHTKRRNCLEHKRLNDLVYIQYNEKIAERFQKRRELGDKFDPIALDDFNWSGEWVGNPDGDVVHPGEDLLWDQVAIAAGPARAVRNLRSKNRDQGGETETNPTEILTYNRHGNGAGSSRAARVPSSRNFHLHDSESEEENGPNNEDDEDIDDDYGTGTGNEDIIILMALMICFSCLICMLETYFMLNFNVSTRFTFEI